MVENAYPVLSDTFGIFNAVIEWLTTALQTVLGMFYDADDGKWTVLGIITLIALAISICFLVIAVIRSFIRFR